MTLRPGPFLGGTGRPAFLIVLLVSLFPGDVGAQAPLRPRTPFPVSSLSIPTIGANSLDEIVDGSIPLSAYIDSIVSTGATDVQIWPTIFQVYPKDNDFSQAFSDLANPPTAKLESFVLALRQRGIGVSVVPSVSVVNSDPNNIILVKAVPSDPLLWLANYRREMLRWAAFAERVGARRFGLFTDATQHLTYIPAIHISGQVPNPDGMEQGWVDLAAAIRTVFSGQLTCVAGSDGSFLSNGFDKIGFTPAPVWNSLDVLGFTYYPEPLTDVANPTVEQLTAAWTKTSAGVRPIDYLKSQAARYGKPVFIGDRSFCSFVGADKDSSVIYDESVPLTLDLQLQANLYESFFRAFVRENGDWLVGVSFSHWDRWLSCPSLPRFLCGPWGERIQGKPAETVLREWYSGTRVVSSRLFVPVVLSLSGQNGSFFTSELTLTNQGTTTATVGYRYTGFTGGGSGTSTASEQIAPGRQLVVPDVIAHLRGLGIPIPDSGNRGGTLRVTCDGVLGSSNVAATVRTTTPAPAQAPTGRAGLAYAGVTPGAFLFDPAYLCGLRQTATDRSAVALQNAGDAADGDATVRISYFAGDGARAGAIATLEVTLAPGEFAQPATPDLGGARSTYYARVERIAGTAPVYCYGVINDNGTNDGSLILPVSSASQIGVPRGITVPVVVETGVYSTELILTNRSTAARALHLTYAASGIPGGSTGLDLQLAAGEQKIIPSFTEFLRTQNAPGISAASAPLAGPLFVTGDLEGVVASARTWNPDPSGLGNYGLFYGGVAYGQSATTSAWLFGLQQTAETRSNLALVNTGERDGSRDTFRIEIYSGETGSELGEVLQDVEARGFVQLGRVLQMVPGAATNGYARVTRVAGNNPFITYAVVNDGGAPGERSGDGAFVAMVKE